MVVCAGASRRRLCNALLHAAQRVTESDRCRLAEVMVAVGDQPAAGHPDVTHRRCAGSEDPAVEPAVACVECEGWMRGIEPKTAFGKACSTQAAAPPSRVTS